MKSSWVEEYIILREKYKDNIESGITEECKKGNIKNRFVVLTLAILCKDNSAAWASRWLKDLSIDRLTRRNQADALFIFAYEALKDVNVSEREEKFIDYLIEYFEWKENKGLLYDIQDNKSSKNVRNMLFSSVVTFEDLYKRIEHVSTVSEYGTMKTTTTDLAAMKKLQSILHEKKSLSSFLDYLLYEDETINDYNKKATFYMQKMLYNIIKNGVDILCDHNLNVTEDEKEEYVEARSFAINSDSKDANAYSRYLKYNGFYIKNRNVFGEWVVNQKDDLTPMKCLDELKKYEINYNGIFTALFMFIVGEKYGSIEKLMKTGKYKEAYERMSISPDTYLKIFQGGSGVYVKRDVIRDLERYISGNKCVSRSLLIVFGLFANYNKQEMNKALRKSGYNELSNKEGLDNAALEIMKYNVGTYIEKAANAKGYIKRKGEATDKRDLSKAEGDIERDEYASSIRRIGEIFEANLTNTDDYALTELFQGANTKSTIKELEEKDAKKFQKLKRG